MDGSLAKVDPPGARLVRAELENILASPSFVRATRLQRLLRFLVERALKNPEDPPKEYEIGLEAFDRDSSFDPQTDAIVRVQAARLRTKLRDYSLAEGRDSPIVIELPKGSYALIIRPPTAAPPEVVDEIPAAPEVEQPVPVVVASAPPRRWLWAVVGATVTAALGFAVMSWRVSAPRPNQSDSTIVPFADYPGDQDNAAFSPDGKEIAFSLQKENSTYSDIYVKLIGAGTPLRLTFDQANKYGPKWSPDGQFVAFVRRRKEGQHAVYVVPALGGSERKLADTTAEGINLSWSPDGRYVAFVDRVAVSQNAWGICLVSPESGERRDLTFPQAKEGDDYPAFSPDGHFVAFVRGRGLPNVTDLYVIPMSGGEPKRITNIGKMIRGVTWTRGGSELIFAANRTGPNRLWRVKVEGGAEPQLVSEAGDNAIHPVISPKTGYLAYTEWYTNVNIWQITGMAGGSWSAPSKLIASSRTQNSPEFSPDGNRIVFASDRSGYDEIWRCERDGSSSVQLTHFEGPPTGTPHWSPDGKWIVFDSRPNSKADIFVVAAEGGPVRRITTDNSQNGVPSWSRDGKGIYFSSNRSGAWQLWRIPFEGGPAVQVTRHGAFDSAESADGQFVYYTKGRKPGMWKVPVRGGEESAVPELSRAGEWRYWKLTDKGYYYAARGESQYPALEFFSFAVGRPEVIGYLQKGPDGNGTGLAVSPDGRTLLYAQLDQSVRDIMLVDHFR